MKMKTIRLFTLLSLFSLVLIACGASNDSSRNYDMASEEMAQVADQAGAGQEIGLELGEKIIETAYMRYETLEFDAALAYVNQEIEAVEAQVQNSSRQQSTSSYGFKGERLTMVIRVPQESLHAFIETLNTYDELVVQQQDIQRDDVSKQYRDNETRIAVLKEEEAVLRELLQEQGSLEELLQIRTRLSELITEREIFEAENQSFDEQIAYSTLHLEIQETDRANTHVTRGFGDRITNAISDSFYRFIATAQNLVITFIYLIPYLLILGIIGFAIFYFWRKRPSKKKIK